MTPPITARYLPWICSWCGYENKHFGVICDRCSHYGQPPAAKSVPAENALSSEKGAERIRTAESLRSAETRGTRPLEMQRFSAADEWVSA